MPNRVVVLVKTGISAVAPLRPASTLNETATEASNLPVAQRVSSVALTFPTLHPAD